MKLINKIPILFTLAVLVSCGNMQSVVSTDDGIYADDSPTNMALVNNSTSTGGQVENGFTKALQNLDAQDRVNRIADHHRNGNVRENSNISFNQRTGNYAYNNAGASNPIYIVNGNPNFRYGNAPVGVYDPFWNDFYGYNYYNPWSYRYGWWGNLGRGNFGIYRPWYYDSFYNPYLPYYGYVVVAQHHRNYRYGKRPFTNGNFRRKAIISSRRNYNTLRKNSNFRRSSTTITRDPYANQRNNTNQSVNRKRTSSSSGTYVRSKVRGRRR